jgi:hypothetical protein
MLERLTATMVSDPWLWLLCAAVAGWMLVGWSLRRWRVYQGRRKKRDFAEREARRWAGHRRDR